jgi:hypothetical protein
MPFWDEWIKRWTSQVRLKGHLCESNAFNRKGDARAWEVVRKKALRSGEEQKTQTEITCLDAYNKYLDCAEQRYTHNTFVEKHTLGQRFIRLRAVSRWKKSHLGWWPIFS